VKKMVQGASGTKPENREVGNEVNIIESEYLRHCCCSYLLYLGFKSQHSKALVATDLASAAD
jgi:hypothetical protein